MSTATTPSPKSPAPTQPQDQVVMVGGHLDSWIAGTGATDNGAGTLVAMEVMRILTALHVQPRRTIRIALWSGEEEGLFGSRRYVREHFGSAPLSTAPDQAACRSSCAAPPAALELKPEQRLISGYFNVDNGSGKISRRLPPGQCRHRAHLRAMGSRP